MSLFFVGKLDPGAFRGNSGGRLGPLLRPRRSSSCRRDASGDAIPSVIAGNLAAAVLALPFAWGDLALDARGPLLVLFLGIFQLGDQLRPVREGA